MDKKQKDLESFSQTKMSLLRAVSLKELFKAEMLRFFTQTESTSAAKSMKEDQDTEKEYITIQMEISTMENLLRTIVLANLAFVLTMEASILVNLSMIPLTVMDSSLTKKEIDT